MKYGVDCYLVNSKFLKWRKNCSYASLKNVNAAPKRTKVDCASPHAG